MPYTFDQNEAARLLQYLSNPSRLKIVKHLRKQECDITMLSQQLKMNESTVASHLVRLNQAGWLSRRRSSRQVYYALSEPSAVLLLQALEEIESTGRT